MRALPGPTDHVVVVGAGLSGLAAALHLLGAGRRVTVVERDAGPGGRAGRLELGGYRVDTGPTVLTMPHLADEAFAAVGDSLHRRVELVALHPAYRARFADGSQVDVHTDGEAMEAEVRRFMRPRGGRRIPSSARLAGTPLPRPDAPLHRHQLRLTPPAPAPGPGAARRLGRLRQAGSADRPLPLGPPPPPGVLLPGAVRGRGTRPRPRRVRRHRLHGHRRGGLVPEGRHARPSPGDGGRGRRRRMDASTGPPRSPASNARQAG